MDVVKSLKKSMSILGVPEQSWKVPVRVRMYMVSQSLMIVNCVLFLKDRWNNIDDRINTLKTLMFILTSLGYTTSVVCYWRDFSSTMNLLTDSNYKFPYKVSSQRKDILSLMEANMRKANRYWCTIIFSYTLSLHTIPLLYVVIRLTVFFDDIQKIIQDTFAIPFVLYYPKYSKRFENIEWWLNILVYVTGYILNSSYAFATGVYAYFINVTTLCAMTNVEFEMRLLRLSLSEMNDVVRDQASSRFSGDFKEYEVALMHFLRYFVRHHQSTCRKVKVYDRTISCIAASLSTIAALYMCMSIYVIVQKDELILKLQEVLHLVIWVCAMYLLDTCGERIKTEDENLRKAMYECSWLDKPKWFKNSLLISMTRSCKSSEMKPFGLFKLNLNSFALTMNAAYSYYNILYNFKK